MSFFSKDTISELKNNTTFCVSATDIYMIVDMFGQKLFFLDLESIDYVSPKDQNKYYFLKLLKVKDKEIHILPNFGEQLNKEEFSAKLEEKVDKKHIIDCTLKFQSEQEISNSKQKLRKFITGKYSKILGRELSDEEQIDATASSGSYKPKSIPNVSREEIEKYLEETLIIDKPVLQKLIKSLQIRNIVNGKIPKQNGIVLFGPGGTGKSEILKAYMHIFEHFLGCHVAKNDYGELLKTTEIKDERYVGAYGDYFGPKFRESISKAREKGRPSLICIDEGDIFVEKPSVSKNPHAADVIKFMKSFLGNVNEFVMVIATNVEGQNLDPIATRRGRINTVEIPLPTIQMAKNIIILMIKRYKIKLERNLLDEELNILAKIVVDNERPGSDIADFCKNFHDQTIDETDESLKGKSYEELYELVDEDRTIPIKEFMQRFEEDIISGSRNKKANNSKEKQEEREEEPISKDDDEEDEEIRDSDKYQEEKEEKPKSDERNNQHGPNTNNKQQNTKQGQNVTSEEEIKRIFKKIIEEEIKENNIIFVSPWTNSKLSQEKVDSNLEKLNILIISFISILKQRHKINVSNYSEIRVFIKSLFSKYSSNTSFVEFYNEIKIKLESMSK